MGRKAITVSALGVLVLDALGGFVVPAVAESIIGRELQATLSTRFGVEVEVDVEVAAPGPLLRGEIASVQITADTYEADVEGRTLELVDVLVVLHDVEVALGDALDGDLHEVRIGASDVVASLDTATLQTLVAEVVAARGDGLSVESVAARGGDLAITLGFPDGSTANVLATPVILEGAVAFQPESATSNDEAQRRARDVIAEIRVALPALPLGITVVDVRSLTSEAIVIGARVPMVIDLS